MINRLSKAVAMAAISLVSVNASAVYKSESYSPFNFLAWGLFSRLDSLQTATDANTLAIEDNKSAIAILASNTSEPVGSNIGSVALSIDCTDNNDALAVAYAENTSVSELRFTITGECFGGFQSASSAMPDLHITGASSQAVASIIPNPDSLSVELMAQSNNVSFTNLNIVAGSNDFNVVSARTNASVSLDSVNFSAVFGNDHMVRLLESSTGSLTNVTINGSDQLRRGVAASSNSYLSISDSTILGTLEQSVNLTTNSTLVVDGTNEFSERIVSSQSVVNITSESFATTGGVSLSAASSMQMSTDSTLISNGAVDVADGSQFRARNLTINDEDLTVQRGSTLRARNEGNELNINNGRIRVRLDSSVELGEGQITSEPGSVALDVSNRSIVTINSADTGTPFFFNGDTNVSNSSIEVEDVVFDSVLELEFGSVAILGAASELFLGFDAQTGSAVYED